MKLDSTKNTRKNFLTGFFRQLSTLIFQFLIRTIIIRQLGAEYTGLNTLFTSVLQVLNLTELGVGNALVFSMYRPIAEDDEQTICALMRLYKKLYRIIGTVILAMGIFIAPIIPQLISDDIPGDVNVYVIYVINLITTGMTYWLFSYRNSLLLAFQRNDVSNKISLIVETLKFIIQVVILYCCPNYYAYLLVVLFMTILNNIIVALVTKKIYPNINPIGKLPQNIIQNIRRQVKDIFTSKLGGVVSNSVDTLVVSAFLGLKCLTSYGGYYYIITLIRGFMTLIHQSARAGIGNKLILDDPEKNYRDFVSFSYLCHFIIAVCTNMYLCGIQPFISVWMGDNWLFPTSVSILFAIYLYVHESATVLLTYKDAAGIWHSDRYRPLISACANLCMNLVLVQIIGIYGIVLSTILSFLLIATPWLIGNAFKFIFKISCWEYIFILFRNALLTAVSGFISFQICTRLPLVGILSFGVNVMIAGMFTVLIFGGFTFRNKDARNSLLMVKNMLQK